MATNEHLTVAEAADRLGITRAQVYAALKSGLLTGRKLFGRRNEPWMIDLGCVERVARGEAAVHAGEEA